MSGYNAAFGDLVFGGGLFASLSNEQETFGITWENICPIISNWEALSANPDLWNNQAVMLSAWADKDIDNTAWSNQAIDGDNWTKIPSDIIESKLCRRG